MGVAVELVVPIPKDLLRQVTPPLVGFFGYGLYNRQPPPPPLLRRSLLILWNKPLTIITLVCGRWPVPSIATSSAMLDAPLPGPPFASALLASLSSMWSCASSLRAVCHALAPLPVTR